MGSDKDILWQRGDRLFTVWFLVKDVMILSNQRPMIMQQRPRYCLNLFRYLAKFSKSSGLVCCRKAWGSSLGRSSKAAMALKGDGVYWKAFQQDVVEG